MATQVVELTGDEAALLRSFDRAVKKAADLEAKLHDGGNAGDAAGTQVEQALERIKSANEKALKAVLADLRSIGPDGRKMAEELKDHLVKAGKLSSTSMDGITASLMKIDPEAAKAAQAIHDKLSRSAKDSGDSIKEELGGLQEDTQKASEAMIGHFEGFIAKVGTGAFAIQQLRDALKFLSDEQEKAKRSLESTQDTDARLLQVSNTPEEFQSNRRLADQLSMEFGVNRAKTGQVVFDQISMGNRDAARGIVRASQVVEPMAASAAGGKLPLLFDKEKLTAEQAISGTLVAAKESEANFEKVASVLPKAAEGSRQLGASMASTAATVSVLAMDFSNADVAADRAKAFTSKAAMEPTLKGLDIEDAVINVSKWKEEDRRKFLGDSMELNAFFTAALPRVDRIREIKGKIQADLEQTKGGGGALEAKINIADQDPELMALRQANRAKEQAEITQMRARGIEGAKASAAEDTIRRDFNNKSFLERMVADKLAKPVASISTAFGLSPDETAAGAGFAMKAEKTVIDAVNPLSLPLFVSNLLDEFSNPQLKPQAAPPPAFTALDSANGASQQTTPSIPQPVAPLSSTPASVLSQPISSSQAAEESLEVLKGIKGLLSDMRNARAPLTGVTNALGAVQP